MDGQDDQLDGPTDHLRCEVCGYDLHGNRSGQCPECGTRGPGAWRMPPEWRILIAALGIPTGILVIWIVWSMLMAVLR